VVYPGVDGRTDRGTVLSAGLPQLLENLTIPLMPCIGQQYAFYIVGQCGHSRRHGKWTEFLNALMAEVWGDGYITLFSGRHLDKK